MNKYYYYEEVNFSKFKDLKVIEGHIGHFYEL